MRGGYIWNEAARHVALLCSAATSYAMQIVVDCHERTSCCVDACAPPIMQQNLAVQPPKPRTNSSSLLGIRQSGQEVALPDVLIDGLGCRRV